MRKGWSVLALACALAGPASAQADVTCKDGATSHAGRGACSDHGGLATNQAAAPAPTLASCTRPAAAEVSSNAGPSGYRPSEPSRRRTPPPGQPTARCKDGSFSYSKPHTGSCLRRGGVARWM
jgi:hypothetical protein